MAGGHVIRGYRTDGSRADIRLPQVNVAPRDYRGRVNAEQSMLAAIHAADIRLLDLTPFESNPEVQNDGSQRGLESELGQAALDGLDILKER